MDGRRREREGRNAKRTKTGNEESNGEHQWDNVGDREPTHPAKRQAEECDSKENKRIRTTLDDDETQEEDDWNIFDDDLCGGLLPPTKDEEEQVEAENKKRRRGRKRDNENGKTTWKSG